MFDVSSAADYEKVLRERFVIVDPDERLSVIHQRLQDIGAKQGGRAERADPATKDVKELVLEPEAFANEMSYSLAMQTAFLVEWPTAACGSFDPGFLRLPDDVLREEMIHVQSYFPIHKDGQLLPLFIAIRDGGEDHLENVVAGWESVLRAKLIDASYFYEQDLKLPLAQRVEDLNGVVFQERLGTIYDKVGRIRRVAAEAARQVGFDSQQAADLDRAALLCKADLTTQMVAELSDLQGIMGREYARNDGERQRVWEAIGEHYQPRYSGDDPPVTLIGQLLAVADKLDTIAACFSVGAIPSGSADPYGLRRAAIGIISILTSEHHPVSMDGLLGCALEALSEQLEIERAAADIASDVAEFLRQRLAIYLRDQGVRYDLVDAALAVGIDDLFAARQRAEALQELSRAAAEFLTTVIACTRPINIAKGFDGGEVDTNLFRDEAERALWDAYEGVLAEADRGDLRDLFRSFTTRLREPIDRYFDEVLVMAEDDDLRQNRLAVCWALTQLFRRLADFSVVVQA
jgi:glycyl-tRNA synthetase beta chain